MHHLLNPLGGQSASLSGNLVGGKYIKSVKKHYQWLDVTSSGTPSIYALYTRPYQFGYQ